MAAAVLAGTAVGCGQDGGDDGSARRSPRPPQIARVRDRTITRADFDRWVGPVLKSSRSAGRDGQQARVRRQIMRFVITNVWMEEEAEDRGIQVRATEIEARFQRRKRRAFPDEASFRQFLHDSGQSEAHLRDRVKMDLLSATIAKQVTRGRGRRAAPLRRFTGRFREKWLRRTACRREFFLRGYCGAVL